MILYFFYHPITPLLTSCLQTEFEYFAKPCNTDASFRSVLDIITTKQTNVKDLKTKDFVSFAQKKLKISKSYKAVTFLKGCVLTFSDSKVVQPHEKSTKWCIKPSKTGVFPPIVVDSMPF